MPRRERVVTPVKQAQNTFLKPLLYALTVLFVLGSPCFSREVSHPSMDVQNAVYYPGLKGYPESIRLTNGLYRATWNGMPVQVEIENRDRIASGDLDGDGISDSAVILRCSMEGIPPRYVLAVLLARGGTSVHTASLPLGEKVTYGTIEILSRDIILEEKKGKEIIRRFVLEGKTLKETKGAALRGLYFVNTRCGWVVGEKGTILHTYDRGLTWIRQESNTTEELNAIFFIDLKHGWCTGNKGTLLQTTDGGESWALMKIGQTKDLKCVFFNDARHGWIVGTKGLILHTGDGGITWKSQKTNVYTVFNSVDFIDSRDGWIAGAYGTILHTVDGGHTWKRQKTGAEAFLNEVHFTGLKNGWAINVKTDRHPKTFLLHTVDGGHAWKNTAAKLPKNVSPESIFFIDRENGWICGEGIILRTADGGASWQAQESGTPASLKRIFFTDGNNGWAVGSTTPDGGIILHTDDGGLRWIIQKK